MADKQSILALMKEKHIFHIDRGTSGFIINDICEDDWDANENVILTAVQLEQLGLEMIALAKLAKQNTQIVSADEKPTMVVTVGGGSEWSKYD